MSAIEDLIDRAHHHGVSPEAVTLADIAESLAGINSSLKTIAEALSSSVPWNVAVR